MQEQLVALKEMFPLENEQLLCDLLLQSNGSIDDAIEKLLSKQRDSSPSDAAHLSPLSSLGNCPAGPSSSSTLQVTDNFAADHDMPSEQLFSSHAHHVLQLQRSRFCELKVHRDRIWRTALGFYKNSLHNRQRLQYEFRVEFDGEEGIDAGALRAEFFQHLLKLVNHNWFEGNSFRRVPKKDCTLEHNFEICGLLIADSILQGGPGFPCLCPAVFSYILYGDKDKALQQLPTIDDIPLNASTESLCNFIQEVFYVFVFVCQKIYASLNSKPMLVYM